MNGSGCTAAGEQDHRRTDTATESRVRNKVRVVAALIAVAGALWFGYHVWELASRTFVTAKVEGTVTEEGKCRRPSGRYQDCLQSKIIVSFVPAGATAPVQAEVLIPRKGVTLAPGDPIYVGYRAADPKNIELPDLSGLLRTPLGVLLTALFILGLERLTR